jgi:hypothetical protein
MYPTTCPCCYREYVYHYDSGEYDADGMQIGPAFGDCAYCGYHYQQHCKHPEREQIEAHRLRCISKMNHLSRAVKWLSRILTKRTGGAGIRVHYWIQKAMINTALSPEAKQ